EPAAGRERRGLGGGQRSTRGTQRLHPHRRRRAGTAQPAARAAAGRSSAAAALAATVRVAARLGTHRRGGGVVGVVFRAEAVARCGVVSLTPAAARRASALRDWESRP